MTTKLISTRLQKELYHFGTGIVRNDFCDVEEE
jgi:hypothetical protein